MSAAQQAQQNNRDHSGRYTERQLADPGDNVLGPQAAGYEQEAEAFLRHEIEPGETVSADDLALHTFIFRYWVPSKSRRTQLAERHSDRFGIEMVEAGHAWRKKVRLVHNLQADFHVKMRLALLTGTVDAWREAKQADDAAREAHRAAMGPISRWLYDRQHR